MAKALERRWLIILTLILLTPGIPEYLTGSSSLFNPSGVIFNIGLYSTGALLIREFAVRFKKGWASILLLGAAYGIMEEGISVHTFFQTSGGPVGALGSYGHFLGVNWVWATGLSLFHSIYSIALPILLLGLIYPQTKGRSLVGNRGIWTTLALYVITVLLLNEVAGSKPSLATYVFFLTLVSVLAYVAWRLPADFMRQKKGKPSGSRRFFFSMGLVFFPVWLIGSMIAASYQPYMPAPLFVVLFLLMSFGLFKPVLGRIGTVENVDRKLYLSAGLLTPVIAFGMIVGLLSGNLSPVFAGIIGIVFLLVLNRRVQNRTAAMSERTGS